MVPYLVYRIFLVLLLCVGIASSVNVPRCKYINYSTQKKEVIINQKLPHDKDCYTQGLLIHNNILYESCGMYGISRVKMSSYPSLQLIRQRDISRKHFAEGIAVVNDTLVMLTWKERDMYVLSLDTLETIRHIDYPFHGWGASSNERGELYVTDGTTIIRKLSIANSTIHVEGEYRVKRSSTYFARLNEMESVGGLFFINVYWKDIIMVVDPTTYSVVGEIVCEVERSGKEEVMNGIAVLPDGRILVTGKNWDSMFILSLRDVPA